MPAEQTNITLGTAGHIDHGKTALIKLLTGCETDRLREEKERGMSIDLGYAPCTLGALEVGIVDVPGHENFIRTMVAGAAGMDGVILVVAADDGIMPQTREHLDIITLLGVRHGLVALTKIDRVSDERREQALTETRGFLHGTFLESAAILPVSSITGEGFPEFLDALAALIESMEPESTEGVFRLPVDRAFSARGFGTIVAGIPVAGAVAEGDEIILLPQQQRGRISGIQVYGRDAKAAKAGQCAALNVRHWDADSIRRGDTVTLPGYFQPVEWPACRLRLLSGVRTALKNGAELRLYTGTSEVNVVVYLMQGDKAGPGEETLVQFRAERPLVVGPGDRFIVRTPSPPATIGGGTVLEALPGRLRRTREGTLEDLEALARAVGSDVTFVEHALRTAPGAACREGEIALRTKTTRTRLSAILDDLRGRGLLIDLGGGRLMHAEALESLRRGVGERLGEFHRLSPERPGMPADELREALALTKDVFVAVIGRFCKEGTLLRKAGSVRLASHEEQFAEPDRKHIERIETLLRESPFKPPSETELVQQTALPVADVRRLVNLLLEHERLVKVAEGLLFHRDAVEEARRRLADYIGKEGRLESVKFKYLLDTTRKYAIPLLDHFDRIGVTIRSGNTRFLRP